MSLQSVALNALKLPKVQIFIFFWLAGLYIALFAGAPLAVSTETLEVRSAIRCCWSQIPAAYLMDLMCVFF